MRTAKEVLEDHLSLSKKGAIEEDLKRKYAEDVILLTSYGTYRGHEGVKELAEILQKELPDVSFEYKEVLVEGEIVFLNGQHPRRRQKWKMEQILM
jgi:hypothetical protein